MARDGRLDVAGIVRVRVENGAVEIQGTVGAAEQKRIAHEIAADVPGAMSVSESLVVSIPSGAGDAELTTRAQGALAVQSDPILGALGVRIVDGIAHVFGQVPDPAREQAAIEIVGRIAGIDQVVSEIWVGEVRPDEATIVADDAVLIGRVMEKLSDNGIIVYNNASTIDHEIVHLRGSLLSPSDAEAAERLALGVTGVQSVKNELVVENYRGSSSPDEVLAARVLQAIARKPNAPAAYLRAICFDGDVYLRGEVDTVEQVWPTLEAARKVPGVKRVFDNITVINRSSQPSEDKGMTQPRRGGRR